MITVEKIWMPSASFGENNPCPDIKNIAYIHAKHECSPAVTQQEKKYIGYGMIDTLLPYRIQDNYDRARDQKGFCAVVLENSKIRAEFLPELGGRLRRIYDKVNDRELLYVNPVFQPGNLALRNAWFSGGVEFNMGIKGHNPMTCDNMWARIDKLEDGEVATFYEYERIRGMVYSISAYLPEDSSVLYIRNRIENKNDVETPMYWWSNIAFPESDHVRVIVPTTESFVCTYLEERYYLDKCDIRDFEGVDASYPENIDRSRDFFYKIPQNRWKWICATYDDGYGLLQCSHDVMKGRKTFVWGQGQGGRNWNEWLSEPGSAYIEIQAGLAHTQLEHLPMQPNTKWEWVEAYMPILSNHETMHGDYFAAVDCIEKELKQTVGDPTKMTFPCGAVIESKIVHNGSDWGYIEEKLRKKRISDYYEFPTINSDEVRLWDDLLTKQTFDAPKVTQNPISYVTDLRLLDMLSKLDKQNWYSELHMGVIAYANQDKESAMKHWQSSLELCENGWAARNIAMLYQNEYDMPQKATPYLLQALSLLPASRTILIECAAHLTNNGMDEKWLSIFDALPSNSKEIARLRLLTAVAYIHLDRLNEATKIINADFMMSDIKEGELSVSHLWFELYRRIWAKENGVAYEALTPEQKQQADAVYPLPRALDFRMH